MKKTATQIVLVLIFTILFSSCNRKAEPLFQRIDLSANWAFSEAGTMEWQPAVVPGTVHTDLYKNGTIPHPFYGCNEKNLQWIGEKDWIYKTSFSVDSSILQKNKIFLVFEGLDTYAHITLNGTKVLSTNNMHRKWEVECRESLCNGDNVLEVTFQSALNKFLNDSTALGYPIPGGQWVLARKAAYHFGWDWGPRYITAGIHKPVYLEIRNNIQEVDFYLFTKGIANNKATLSLNAQIWADGEEEATLKVTDKNSGKTLAKQEININSGDNTYSMDFAINNPKLWWCNGLGEPYIYDFAIELTTAKGFSYTKEIPLGIQTLQTVLEDDEHGKSLYVELNGERVFMKGADYIPQHPFVSEVTDEDYRNIISMAAESNMNMLRVWGGGVYPNDAFFELCNRHGILVWQDFMFACAMYPGTDDFVDNVRHEAIEQVKRIRNHSNVALWCGNNESDEGWHNWGWQKAHAISKKDSATIWEGYKRIFHEVLPEVVSSYDPQKFYMPSSPMHGWGHEESMLEGSAHYWGVWWGALPFEMYLEKVPRFMSEYGFQAMPTLVTIREFQEEDDDYLFSPTLRCHQKHLTGYETINIYLEREGLKPKTLENFIYQSQLIQAKGIGMAIEAHRRAKPYCMGSLLWQINDCWPVVSWSSIDAFGNWKALQYRLRELYDDIMVSVIDHKDNVEIYVVSDRLTETKGTVEVNLVDFNGQETNVFTENLTVASNASRQVLVKQSREIFMGIDTATTLIECIFKTPEKEYSNQKFIVPYGEINLPVPEISTRVEPAEHGYNIYLTSNAFTAYAQLYLTKSHAWFSDNFINLFPNREYAIFCRSDLPLHEFNQQLRIHHLALKD